MIRRSDYIAAIDVQQASNAMGVAHSLYEVMCRIEGGTRTKAAHPVVKLFVAKLADLAGLQYEWPTLVWDHVYQVARDPNGKPDDVIGNASEVQVQP